MTALNQLIELLKLEKIDDLLFRGASQDLGFRQVFGGQVVAQALSAAIQVAPQDRFLHSCHAYFFRRATVNIRLFMMSKFYVKAEISRRCGSKPFNINHRFVTLPPPSKP